MTVYIRRKDGKVIRKPFVTEVTETENRIVLHHDTRVWNTVETMYWKEDYTVDSIERG